MVTYYVEGTNNYECAANSVHRYRPQEIAKPAVTGSYTYTGSEQIVVLNSVER